MKKQLLTFLALLITGIISAQVGIGTNDPKSGLEINTSLGYKVATITSATTLDDTYNVILCNNGPYTVTLPPAAANASRVYRIKNIDLQGDVITIDPNGSETIDGDLTYALQRYKHSVTLISNGTNWNAIVSYNEGTITTINCGSATNFGTLNASTLASGVSSVIPYTGGDGGIHSGQTVTSTGVTGLTATLSPGSFASGSGNLTYTITGTPSALGTATFALNIGGKTCNLTRTVFCSQAETIVIDVTNPTTGRTWMDRNLGASQFATASNDAASYGDLYQWGRAKDGHQCRNSDNYTTVLSTDGVANFNNNSSDDWYGKFITRNSGSNNWVDPAVSDVDNLWQGVNGINNPCPSGYRIPTSAEWDAERLSWGPINAAGALASVLKLPMAGYFVRSSGSTNLVGSLGVYWSSTVSTHLITRLVLNSTSASANTSVERANGYTVRCIKD